MEVSAISVTRRAPLTDWKKSILGSQQLALRKPGVVGTPRFPQCDLTCNCLDFTFKGVFITLGTTWLLYSWKSTTFVHGLALVLHLRPNSMNGMELQYQMQPIDRSGGVSWSSHVFLQSSITSSGRQWYQHSVHCNEDHNLPDLEVGIKATWDNPLL